MIFIIFCLLHLHKKCHIFTISTSLFLDSTHYDIIFLNQRKRGQVIAWQNVTIQSSWMAWYYELNCHGLLPDEMWHQNICVWWQALHKLTGHALWWQLHSCKGMKKKIHMVISVTVSWVYWLIWNWKMFVHDHNSLHHTTRQLEIYLLGWIMNASL